MLNTLGMSRRHTQLLKVHRFAPMVHIKPFDVPLVSSAVTSVGDKKVITFTYTNLGYVDYIINLAGSIHRAGCEWKLIVFCTDQGAKERLSQLNAGNIVPIEFYHDVSTKLEMYDTVPYKQIVLVKMDILTSLQTIFQDNTSVTHIFYLDGDVVVFKDPLRYLLKSMKDADLLMQCGEKTIQCTGHTGNKLCSNCCSGVMLSKVSPSMLKLFSYEDIDPKTTKFDGDQDYINDYLAKNTLQVITLPVSDFPNGFHHHQNFPDRYLIHYNYIFANQKIPVMKYYHHWNPQVEKRLVSLEDYRPQIMVNYPPWADELLESYFYTYSLSHRDELTKAGWTYLDVFWTNLYVNADQFGKPYDKNALQGWLDRLPLGKYFTIVQHDDGIRERLPPGTVVFASGGGKGQGSKICPVPLIYLDQKDRLEKYALENQSKPRDIFFSFVGSITHGVRHQMLRYTGYPDIKTHITGWSNQVSTNNQEIFLDLTQRSVFAGCPRGYGETSFRLFEVMKLGAIPVYIWEDRKWLPFQGKIDYSKLCVLVPGSELPNLYERLKKISPEEITSMREYYQSVKHFFTLEGTSRAITQYLTTVPDPPKLISENLEKSVSTLYFEIEEAGFGAMLSRVMTGLGIALEFGMKPSFQMKGCRYVFPFDLGWNKSISESTNVFDFKEPLNGAVMKWDFLPYFRNCSYTQRFQYPEAPARFDLRMTRHQWSACLMKFIADHANDNLRKLVSSTKEKFKRSVIGSDQTIIGIHVRRGDKVQDNPNVPTKVYLDILKKLVDSRKIDNPVILLASDDPNVCEEVRNMTQIPVLWDSDEKRHNNANWKYVQTSDEIAEEESYTAAKNILLLGDCDYVIGTHNAQFTWLGGLLCVAKHDGDINRHLMIYAKPINGSYMLSHWAADYHGFGSPVCPAATI